MTVNKHAPSPPEPFFWGERGRTTVVQCRVYLNIENSNLAVFEFTVPPRPCHGPSSCEIQTENRFRHRIHRCVFNLSIGTIKFLIDNDGFVVNHNQILSAESWFRYVCIVWHAIFISIFFFHFFFSFLISRQMIGLSCPSSLLKEVHWSYVMLQSIVQTNSSSEARGMTREHVFK